MTAKQKEQKRFEVPQGVDQLEDYLMRKKLSMRTYAAQVGVWPSRLCKIMQGKVAPTLKEACAISAPIRGMKAEDWLAEVAA